MKILIIDPVHKILPDLLIENGHDILIDLAQSYDYYLELIPEYEGIIIRSGIKIDKAFIDHAQKLKFIARVGAGMENIDVAYAENKNIICINSPEGNRTAVGEQAIGMLLSLFNNLNKADQEVRQAQWNREANRGIELEGKRVGIIGYGNMGSAFAQRLIGFDVEVIAFDKYKTNYSDEYVRETSMEELFEKSDIISIHLPLNEETAYLINEEWISKFKKDFYLVNTARGPIVKTDDLVKALENGKIKGACLDVLEYEKLGFENIDKDNLPTAFQYLSNSSKVILSPHIAGWTHESNYKLSRVIADKILGLFNN
ncbi:MAG: hydroxyacid dehydrogenase [Bacteroidetes bacterium]|nr:MAG: hydroxyacid dehydrogenase [Bacteroidota bacterium]